ncbi:TPA: OPT superfamily [Trebouxia sp. C0004]
MLTSSPKRRNSDVMNPDSDGARSPQVSESVAARSNMLVTPFKNDSDTDFDTQRRENSQYAASTSEALNGQQHSAGRHDEEIAPKRQLTIRAVATGLCVGSILCFSNTYFGLQTGWVTMGSLQSAILGFGVFRVLHCFDCMKGFTVEENVIVQTTSVATATMPLAAGLVGVIPAMGIMTVEQNPPDGPVILSYGQLVLWSLALAFLGVFCAVPLRTQTILKEKLKFPSGTATANVIRTLHAIPTHTQPPEQLHTVSVIAEEPDMLLDEVLSEQLQTPPHTPQSPGSTRSTRLRGRPICASSLALTAAKANRQAAVPLMMRSSSGLHSHSIRLAKQDSINSLQTKLRQQFRQRMSKEDGDSPDSQTDWEAAWKALLWSFAAASVYTLLASWIPAIHSFPVASWLGMRVVTDWGWEVTPSMGYIGQGMIMGPKTAFSMLAGAVVGYGILGPFARYKGWAPGPIGDWKTGATGWVLWVSLAIMLSDSLTSLSLLLFTSLKRHIAAMRTNTEIEDDQEHDLAEERIPTAWWVGGLVLSGAFCTAMLTPMLDLPVIEPLAAVGLALLVAVLAVRALGQTDLNPVSGVGKLSQGVFAIIAPGRVVPNLVAGAIAEAGAQQAGDMMQDFKTAHLLGVCPRAQFYAMLMGSFASVFVSVGAYALYTSAFQIPGPEFPVPTAEIWLDMAELVNGGQLPPCVIHFCIVSAVLAALLPLASFFIHSDGTEANLDQVPDASSARSALSQKLLRALPSGIGFAVGMYVAPKWTIPRVIGSLIEQSWLTWKPRSHASLMVVVASGLVLGEGTASIVTAVSRAIGASFS